MNTRFIIAKFIPDVFRNEPKNIGVIVWSPQGVAARFFGERAPGDIDGRSVRHGCADTGAYKQWITYWRECLNQEIIEPVRGGTPVARTSKEFLDVLCGESVGQFFLEDGGEAATAAADSLQICVDDLYRRIVDDEPIEYVAPKDDSLQDVADSILSLTHIREAKGFIPDFVPPTLEQCKFSFGFQNGKLSLFQKVSFPLQAPFLEKNYKSTAWDFQEVLGAHVISDKTDGYSLIHVTPERADEKAVRNAIGALERVSTVYNLHTEGDRFALKLEELKASAH